jgi:hypothetical protein
LRMLRAGNPIIVSMIPMSDGGVMSLVLARVGRRCPIEG